MNISLKILFNLLYSIYNKYKYQRTCTMKEYVSRFSDSFCCIVCGCVRVTAPIYCTFTQKTFNGPLHVYFPNTHAHEWSLREVNLQLSPITSICDMIFVSLYLTNVNMIILAEIVHQSSCKS